MLEYNDGKKLEAVDTMDLQNYDKTIEGKQNE